MFGHAIGRARLAPVVGGRLMDFENSLAHDSSRESDWSDACEEPSGVAHVCAEIETVRARFTRVVLPHLDDARALARHITGNATDADDVVQDACLQALRAIVGFADGNARAWLLTIVRHSAYRWMRKNRPQALVLVDDLDVAACTQAAIAGMGGKTPEAALIAKRDAERVEAAIAAIPAPFRETVVLREIDGLDYRAIARLTEVPIGTVMSRLARARRRLVAAVASALS
jgi:RNA polymerase sigma factor (sigma-70 family)